MEKTIDIKDVNVNPILKDELIKFFKVNRKLLRTTGESASMISDSIIDEYWHKSIQEKGFIESLNLGNIKHIKIGGFGELNWVNAYHELYGSIPEIWFIDAGGNLKSELYSKYLELGSIVAAWDCTPA
jgi:hypothetical protein